MGLQKKSGIINEIIYEHIACYGGTKIHYLPIPLLRVLIDEIKKSGATTKYIRVTPFYRVANNRIYTQEELDDFMFYLECKEDFTEEDVNLRTSEAIARPYSEISEEDKQAGVDWQHKDYEELTEEEKRRGHILLPLCRHGDVNSYKQALERYENYLEELIPLAFEEAKRLLELKETDYPFGYFCFEVQSE